jgi:cold shock CspA family protein
VRITGHVESFDDHRGDGMVRSDDGERFYFHCVEITNGSRHLDVGVRVTARRAVGHVGRDEAFEITEIFGDETLP